MNNVELDPNPTEILNLSWFGILGLELDSRFDELGYDLRETNQGFGMRGAWWSWSVILAVNRGGAAGLKRREYEGEARVS